MAVGDDGAAVGRQLAHGLHERLVRGALRLEHRDLVLQRRLLDRRGRGVRTVPTLWTVGSGHDPHDVEALTEERSKRGDGEVRSTVEEDAHFSSPAGSGVTSRR